MSEKPNSTQVRLLKANNVQRRRLEKMADDVIDTSKRAQLAKAGDQKELIYNKVVEQTMGAELGRLLAIRAEIQQHKQAIEELRKIGDIRRRLNKRGIKCSSGDTWPQNYRGTDYGHFEYYLDPPAVDEKSEDVCERVVGNPHVQLRLMDCQNNPPYARYTQACKDATDIMSNFKAACDVLRQDIWVKVSTEEIQEAMNAFQKEWSE